MRTRRRGAAAHREAAALLSGSVRLGETIGRWVGKVEIVLAGADDALREGEEALAAGDAMRARAAARRVLARAPESPLGLALLADACEVGGLDAELALTLEELSHRAASRAEVWVRLGRARRATLSPMHEVRDAFVRALAVAEPGSDARHDALLELADLDLLHGDGARAELWLERAHTEADDKSSDVAVRRAEARLLQGDAKGAASWLEGVESSPADARAALARGRALAVLGDAAAFAPLLRATVLEAKGASELLSSTLAWVPSDEATRARIRTVVDAKGEGSLARWRAAFARAEGERDAARGALRDAVAGGDASAARPLLDAGLDDRDYDAVAAALPAIQRGPQAATRDVEDARRIPSPEALADPTRIAQVLDDLGAIESPRVLPWADALCREASRAWIPASGAPAGWSLFLARLDAHARQLADLDAVARVADLSAERRRPVRVAVVGEFNAGKSTFINALIGADVAPTGVLPTTATLHHLRYAPDPIARILFTLPHDPPERIVAVTELRATLKTIGASTTDREEPGGSVGAPETESIRRVEILLPIASLTRVEILDTPGFNAPDARHTEAARAAFEEADAAIWLLDAAQAMKQTERKILDEAKAAKLPVQMLVNKADRLGEADLAKVMALVDASLRDVGLASWRAPLALSAKKALAGKLGDAAALESSGWAAVQSLLDEEIVARSEELKERSLRRRALHVVGRLAARAATAANDERTAADARKARTHTISQTAAKLDREADETAVGLAKSLLPAAATWKSDVDVVVTGRDPDAVARDRVLSRYRIDRALDRLAPPLAHALVALAPDCGVHPAQTLPLARHLVRAAAACSDGKSYESIAAPLARAAVSALTEHLFALALPPEPPARAAGLLRELGACADALA